MTDITARIRSWFDDALRAPRWLMQRLTTLEFVDRALVVGAQAFSALIPLMIVLAGVGSQQGSGFAEKIIDKFGLTGDGADSVRRAFSSPATNTHFSVLATLLVVFSALSFTRALQRTFELTWDLPRIGMRGTHWGLIWLAAFGVYWTLVPLLRDWLPGSHGTLLVLAESAGMWLLTPYLLLARRVPWRRLLPQALITSLGMLLLSVWVAIYAPHAVSTSAERYGAIGVAFAMMTILWGAGIVLVVGAVIGAGIAQRGGAQPPLSASTTPKTSPSR